MSAPLFIFTGFLGSGKTTLITRLLAHKGPRTAVLINEVGQVPLDHHLVETIEEDLSVLPSGCICCTLRGALSERLLRVLELSPARIVLETTGLANPAPVLHALSTHPELSHRLRLGATVVALDALRGEPLLDRHPEAQAQLSLADRVVLTKVDLASAERIEALEARARAQAPGAVMLRAAMGHIDPERLWNEAPLSHLKDHTVARRWLTHHPHSPHDPHDDHEVHTEVLELDGPVDSKALQLWLRLVTQLDGPRLLRIKGIVEDHEGRSILLQSAEHAVAPARTLAQTPAGWRGSRLVLITRDLPKGVLDRLLESARSAAAGVRANT